MPKNSSNGKIEREYKGVRMRSWGKWVSEIRISSSTQGSEEGERIWLDSFDSSMKAALAYDFAAFYLRGNKAKLNFPRSPPPPSHNHHFPTKWQTKEAASRYANHTIATTMIEEHNRKASQAGNADATLSGETGEVPGKSSSTSANTSSNTKEEDTANQLNTDTDSTHLSDQLQQRHLDLLDDDVIEGLCGFLRSYSNTN